MPEPDDNRKGYPALTVLIAVMLLIAASFVPWGDLTGGTVKDFCLWSDLLDEPADTLAATESTDAPIDPMLARLMAEDERGSAVTATDASSDTAQVSAPDSTIISNTVPADTLPAPMVAVRDSSGVVPIEDYTPGGTGLSRLATALLYGGSARIAVVGDSYIEGDIFTQDLRALLQEAYGGSGVGYMGFHTDFPGFRRSVRQSGSGWRVREIGKKGSKLRYEGLAEHYYVPSGKSTATYKGTDKVPHAATWDVTDVLLVAPRGGTVTVTTDAGPVAFTLAASADSVQCLTVNGVTASATVAASDSTIAGLGVWLDSRRGVGVDCMSSRGFSGLTLGQIDTALCRRMGAHISYQLIVLEFGINAISPGQKNFKVYRQAMTDVVAHLRQCYPDAEFLIMGIGDRGEKRGGEVRSMASVPYMIEAQRDAARHAGCLFWDTREAMGGQDAIVEWTRGGFANKDYIHMTHKGGARLADEFYRALRRMLP